MTKVAFLPSPRGPTRIGALGRLTETADTPRAPKNRRGPTMFPAALSERLEALIDELIMDGGIARLDLVDRQGLGQA